MDKTKSIDIICPLYNAEIYLENFVEAIEKQTIYNQVNNIRFAITESKDKTLEKVQELAKKNKKIIYKEIKKEDFSHSLTRETEAREANADIIVFITQDVKVKKENWLENLVKPIEKNEVQATYSRQLCTNNTIERYTRECNYPKESKIVSKEDINKLGLKTFFFSDASGAINRKIFNELNGYDEKRLPISEDMYFAYKLIMNGYKIEYCADSEVMHSHTFTLKQIYDRYKLTGKFFKQNSYLDKYGTNGSGWTLAKYVLKRAFQEHNIKVIFRWLPDMTARYLGMKEGKK